MDNAIEIAKATKQTLAIQIDPSEIFKKNGSVLDPTNPKISQMSKMLLNKL